MFKPGQIADVAARNVKFNQSQHIQQGDGLSSWFTELIRNGTAEVTVGNVHGFHEILGSLYNNVVKPNPNTSGLECGNVCVDGFGV